MFQPTEFLDGENIVIIGRVPHYRYTGVTYRDKLKNGLSLDYVFDQQDMVPICPEESTKEIESNEVRENLELIDYEENHEFYEQKEFQTMGLSRKGKRAPFKKRQARNVKKNCIRQRGYEDKLFDIEQNVPNLSDKSQIDINYYEIDYDVCYGCGDRIKFVYCDFDRCSRCGLRGSGFLTYSGFDTPNGYDSAYNSDDDNWSFN